MADHTPIGVHPWNHSGMNYVETVNTSETEQNIQWNDAWWNTVCYGNWWNKKDVVVTTYSDWIIAPKYKQKKEYCTV